MFARIRNMPVDYAWGTHGEITRLLGDDGVCRSRRDDGLEAELWLGAHHGSPSELVDPHLCGGATDLREWIAADPIRTLGPLAGGLRADDAARLPFLVKVLAAGAPLSLQAHPSLADARAGFAREQADGVPLSAPHRNYKDPSHKPELLLALSETMEALAGFRPHDEAVATFERLAQVRGEDKRMRVLVERVRSAADEAGRRELVAWLLGGSAEAIDATEAVLAAAGAADDAPPPSDARLARDVETVRLLAQHSPGDPGIVIALLLNRLTLQRGEAIFVGAGSLHAYLRGVGLEVMASSDNVLRGGLTPKHVDVPELLRVLDASAGPAPYLAPGVAPDGVLDFVPPVPDFRLSRVTLDGSGDGSGAGVASARVRFEGPAIALCLSGSLRMRGAVGETRIAAGEALFVTPDEGALEFEGAGDVVLASTAVAAGETLPLA